MLFRPLGVANAAVVRARKARMQYFICAYRHISCDIAVQKKVRHSFLVAVQDCSDILKALSDRTRQRIVKVLLTADRGVNELTEDLNLSQYNTSKHLRVLKQAGIVDVRA